MAFQAVSWVYGWEMTHHRQSNLQGTTRRQPALPHQQIHACLFVCYKCPTEFKGDNGKVEKVTSKECFRVWKTNSSVVMFLFDACLVVQSSPQIRTMFSVTQQEKYSVWMSLSSPPWCHSGCLPFRKKFRLVWLENSVWEEHVPCLHTECLAHCMITNMVRNWDWHGKARNV